MPQPVHRKFTIEEVTEATTGRDYQSLYYQAIGVSPQQAATAIPEYTIHDFKKVAAIVYLMSQPAHIAPNLLPLIDRAEAVEPNWRIVFTSNPESQAVFGCNISSLGTSLSKATEIIRDFFPANTEDGSCIMTINFRGPNRSRYNNSFTDATLKITNCSDILAALDDTVHTRRSNLVLANRTRDQPMPAPTSRQIQGIEVNNSATIVNELQDRELANNYQRELSTLLRSRESNRNEMEDVYELSGSNIEHFIENCREFHPGNRYFSTINANRRSQLSFGARKLAEIAFRKVHDVFRNVAAHAIPMVPELTAQNARTVATYTSYKGGFSFKNESGQRCFAIKLGRSKVEEFFKVGNSGANRNRERFPQEVRQAVRDINLLLESCQMTLTTFKVRALEGAPIPRNGDTSEPYRLFVLTNVPQYGMRFRIGENPFFPRVISTSRRDVPEFFKNPLHGKPTGISNIFKFLMGQEPELPIEAPGLAEALADIMVPELPPAETASQQLRSEGIRRALDEIISFGPEVVQPIPAARAIGRDVTDSAQVWVNYATAVNTSYSAARSRGQV